MIHWVDVSNRFLDAVAPQQREKVAELLHTVHNGGSGLRDWVSAIAYRGAILPKHLPEELIEVYLTDFEVIPLHDCGGCGLAMPIRPSRLYGPEGEPERVYFATCPACGSRTGSSMYFSRQFEDKMSDKLRRRPR